MAARTVLSVETTDSTVSSTSSSAPIIKEETHKPPVSVMKDGITSPNRDKTKKGQQLVRTREAKASRDWKKIEGSNVSFHIDMMRRGFLVTKTTEVPGKDITPAPGEFFFGSAPPQARHLTFFQLPKQELRSEEDEKKELKRQKVLDWQREKQAKKLKTQERLRPKEKHIGTPLPGGELKLREEKKFSGVALSESGTELMKDKAVIEGGTSGARKRFPEVPMKESVAKKPKKRLPSTKIMRTKVPTTVVNPETKFVRKKLALQDHKHLGLLDTHHIALFNKLQHLQASVIVSEALHNVFSAQTPLSNLVRNYLGYEQGSYEDLVGNINPEHIIINKKRKDEIFLPMTIGREAETLLYTYFWMSRGTVADVIPPACQRVITAACFLASALQGINDDSNSKKFNLIKHDINMQPGERIVATEHNREVQIYKLEFFAMLKNMLAMLNQYGGKELFLHLPIHDYLLFGIQLAIRRQITPHALNQYFREVWEEGHALIKQMQEMCVAKKIHLRVGSPFQPLFAGIETQLRELKNAGEEGDYVTPILLELGIMTPSLARASSDDDGPTLPDRFEIKHSEEEFVQQCLLKLTTDSVWRDIMRVRTLTNKDREGDGEEKTVAPPMLYQTLTDIDKLFQVGNGAWVLMGTKGLPNHAAWVFEAISENPIPLMAKKLGTSEELKEIYPSTINLSYVDRVQTHSANLRGQSFYQSREPLPHNRMFTTWERIAPRILKNEMRDEEIMEEMKRSLTF